MTTLPTPQTPTYFASAVGFRAWLAKHAASASELIVGFHKVGSDVPSMSWPDSVDEALCFGWIDGVRKRIDDTRYQIRFTPRKKTSIWSAVNIAKFEALSAAGKMTDAGRAAYAFRTERKSVVYAYEQADTAELSAAELQTFKQSSGGWDYFQATPPSYRKVVLHWVVTAKKPETRAARFEQLLQACVAGQRLR